MRWRLLAVFGLLLACAGEEASYARRAVAFVAACTPVAPNAASPQSMAACAISAGETVVVFSASDTGTPVTFSTDKSDIFTASVCIARGGTTSILCGAAICAAVGGSTIITATTASATFDSIHATRYTGLRTASCVTDNDTAQSPNSGNDTAAPPFTSKSFALGAGVSGSVLVGGITANNSDAAPNNGETEDSQTGVQYNVSQQHHILAAANTMSWTWGANNRWNAVVLELEEPAASATLPAAILNAVLRGGGLLLCAWSMRRRRDA